MKLYTEEELRKHLYNHSDEFFDKLTPIELPSDEEIEKASPFVWGSYVFGTRDLLVWELGAKWMRDKIQGGNK